MGTWVLLSGTGTVIIGDCPANAVGGTLATAVVQRQVQNPAQAWPTHPNTDIDGVEYGQENKRGRAVVAWKGGQAMRKRGGGPWWHGRAGGRSSPLWERSPSFEGAATALDAPTADSVACACMCEWPSSSPPKMRSDFSM